MYKTVLIFVQLITVILCGHCPPGLLWHQEVSKCCKPIKHCEPGHQVKPCKESEGQDYCAPCPAGQKNSFNTSSFDMITCKKDSCQSDTILDKNRRCICNLQKGYIGEDPKLCSDGGQLCHKGKELKLNGDCKSCLFGYYKDWEGRGFCKKHINCTLLQLEYKGNGNSQEPASCKIPQTDSKDPDERKPKYESNTLGITTETAERFTFTSFRRFLRKDTRDLMVAKTEKSAQQDFTEQVARSDYVKNYHSANENLFPCNFQIIVAVLGVLLFLSSMLIIYLVIKKKSTVKKVNAPLKPTISDVGRCNSWNQRPLPIVPRQRTYSTPEYDQYIPMNASRHASCSSNTNVPDGIFKQQEIKDGWRSQNQDTYNNNIASPLNESTYVKIEPLSLNYHT